MRLTCDRGWSAFYIPFVSSVVETLIGGAQPHGISTSLDANGVGGWCFMRLTCDRGWEYAFYIIRSCRA